MLLTRCCFWQLTKGAEKGQTTVFEKVPERASWKLAPLSASQRRTTLTLVAAFFLYPDMWHYLSSFPWFRPLFHSSLIWFLFPLSVSLFQTSLRQFFLLPNLSVIFHGPYFSRHSGLKHSPFFCLLPLHFYFTLSPVLCFFLLSSKPFLLRFSLSPFSLLLLCTILPSNILWLVLSWRFCPDRTHKKYIQLLLFVPKSATRSQPSSVLPAFWNETLLPRLVRDRWAAFWSGHTSRACSQLPQSRTRTSIW